MRRDQDRDGAPFVLRLSRRSFPFVTKAFAGAGNAGDRPATATCIIVEIVRKPADQVSFAVHRPSLGATSFALTREDLGEGHGP